MKIYNKEELEAMDLSELKKYLEEEIPKHIKEVKAVIRHKNKPSESLSISQGYVYANYRKEGKTKADYLGKYGEASTLEKIKVLAEDRAEIIEMYEKLSSKIKPV